MAKKKQQADWANCCNSWGDYMDAKKAKLEQQFQEATKHECQNPSTLFKGIAIFVNGYTNPNADELRHIMMSHGGIYHHYLHPKSTTHMIASNLPYSKIISYRKACNPLPLCKPDWITDSIKAGQVLDFKKYLLYSQFKNVQPLMFPRTSKPIQSHYIAQSSNTYQNVRTFNPTQICNSKILSIEKKYQPQLEGTPRVKMSSMIVNCTENPEFLTEYYKNSRLHHIATMRATFKDYINILRNQSTGIFAGLEALKTQSNIRFLKSELSHKNDDSYSDDNLFKKNQYLSSKNLTISSSVEKNQIIMHIDMDCFFVSVGLRDHPELKGLPIAVAHAKGNAHQMMQSTSNNANNANEYGSMSEVASCSYEARKAGVKNGMLLGQALKLCPHLKTIKYNFDGYKEVSFILYDTIASYTLDIEAVSCDEMYVDCTKILHIIGLTPLDFAKIIRKEIQEKTGCPVSTGFGENKLQARLATRKAKPNGQFHLQRDYVKPYIRTLSVRNLPGVGYTTYQKLHQMNIQTCADLEVISLYELQKKFGKKNGQQLHDMSRGIDHSKLDLEHIKKSISAEVNYGIRFENSEAAHEFIKQLCMEISDRLKKFNIKGKIITLKGMFRSKEAPNEPKKFMGHGLCDIINKSKNLLTATDDAIIITKEVLHLWNQLHQNPVDARGLGIQITKLETKNKSNDFSFLKFINTKKIQEEKDEEIDMKTLKTSNTYKNEEILISKEYNSSKKTHGYVGHEQSRDENATIFQETHAVYSKANNQSRRDYMSKSFIQFKQMKRFEYFKQKKPNNRLGKTKLPDINEIDMNVLIELPQSIRNEILDEYKKSSEKSDIIELAECMSNVNKNNSNVKLDKDISFSQIDPEFLLALPIEIKNEMKTYCNEQKKKNVNLKNIQTNNMIENGWDIFKNDNKFNKSEKIKSKKLKLNKISEKNINNNILSSNESKIAQVIKNKTSKRVSEKNFQAKDVNKSLYFDYLEENIEQSKMLTRIVKYLLNLPISQVKLRIREWIFNNSIVNNVDFLTLTTYLGILPKKRRLEDLYVILKCLNRIITESENCVWHETYKKVLEHIQTRMCVEYTYPLMIPEQIDCDKCTI